MPQEQLNSLKISCPVSAEKILQAEANFHNAVKKIADLKRDEQNAKSFLKKYRRFFIWCLYALSSIGIALSILTLLPIGICKTDYLSSIGLLIFFVSIIVIFKNEQKIANTLWEKFNSLIADSRTEHMFKVARRLIPFDANYYFSNNTVTYMREKDGKETTNWSKPISGQYYIDQHFIITYKKKSFYPDLFIFINGEAQIAEYMNNLGLTRIYFPELSTITSSNE